MCNNQSLCVHISDDECSKSPKVKVSQIIIFFQNGFFSAGSEI